MVSGSPWLALLALDSDSLPSPDAVAQTLSRSFPDAPPWQATSQSGNGVTFQWESVTGNCTLVDRPIPWDRLEGPCETAWYWPEAAEVMRGHAAHLFITLLDEGTRPIDTAIRLTQLTTSIAEAAGAVGLVWGPSGQVHKPEDFAALAQRIAPEDLPLHLWIDFRVTQQDDPEALALFTTGLEALGHREFETPRFHGDPQHLAGTVYNVAHYVLEKGAVLKEGEAIGLPGGGQVTVSLGPSMVDESQQVLQLHFE